MPGPREILFESVKAMERQVAGFHALAPYFMTADPREKALSDMLAKIADLVGADAGAVMLADESAGLFELTALRWAHLTLEQVQSNEKALRLFRLKLNEGIVGQVFHTQEPVNIPDAQSHQTFQREMAAAINYHVRNILAVPIFLEARPIGVLELLNKVPRGTFSAPDMALAVSLAQQVGVILSAWRSRPAPTGPTSPTQGASSDEELLTLRRQTRDAQAQLKETRALLDTAVRAKEQDARRIQMLTDQLAQAQPDPDSTLPPAPVMRLLRSVESIVFPFSVATFLNNFGELALRLAGAECLRIALWDPGAKRFQWVYGVPASVGGAPPLVEFQAGEGVAGLAAERKAWLAVADVTRDDHFSKSIDETPDRATRSLLAGPLLARGEVVGVVEAVNRADGKPFLEEHGISLSGLAHVAAVGLERAIFLESLTRALTGREESIRLAANALGTLTLGSAERPALSMEEALIQMEKTTSEGPEKVALARVASWVRGGVWPG